MKLNDAYKLLDGRNTGGVSPEDALIWWYAYRAAEQMHADYTVKDWARLLVGGYAPVSTMDVEDLLTPGDPDDGHDFETDDEIKETLLAFFPECKPKLNPAMPKST